MSQIQNLVPKEKFCRRFELAQAIFNSPFILFYLHISLISRQPKLVGVKYEGTDRSCERFLIENKLFTGKYLQERWSEIEWNVHRIRTAPETIRIFSESNPTRICKNSNDFNHPEFLFLEAAKGLWSKLGSSLDYWSSDSYYIYCTGGSNFSSVIINYAKRRKNVEMLVFCR